MTTSVATSTAQLLKTATLAAHRIILAAVSDVDNDIANRPAGGTASPIGVCFAHHVVAEDRFINQLLLGKPPLESTAFADRTGIKEWTPHAHSGKISAVKGTFGLDGKAW